MLPLIIKDGLTVPFISLMILYPIIYFSFYPKERESTQKSANGINWSKIIPALGVSRIFYYK